MTVEAVMLNVPLFHILGCLLKSDQDDFGTPFFLAAVLCRGVICTLLLLGLIAVHASGESVFALGLGFILGPYVCELLFSQPDFNGKRELVIYEIVCGLLVGLCMVGLVAVGILVDVSLYKYGFGSFFFIGMGSIFAFGIAAIISDKGYIWTLGSVGCISLGAICAGLLAQPGLSDVSLFSIIGGLNLLTAVGIRFDVIQKLGRGKLLPYFEENGRTRWFLWTKRPSCRELERALHNVSVSCPHASQVWKKLSCRLSKSKQSPRSIESLIARLQSNHWEERFLSWHLVVTLGGQAVESLLKIVRQKDSTHQKTAVWLITSIAEDTTARLRKHARQLLCPDHLTHCGAHRVRLSRWRSVKYYGCRVCSRSRELLEWPRQIVAVLDQKMTQEQERQETTLRVNWLMRAKLFDFDQIEILNATDEDVERFAVQVGNDTDEFRRPRYKKMHCLVTRNCQLSENTLRILNNLFGQVEHHT